MFAYKLSDDADDLMLKKAFDGNYADDRKTMIKNFNGVYLDYEHAKTVSCCDYVNQELLHYLKNMKKRQSLVKCLRQFKLMFLLNLIWMDCGKTG
jgi:hypothetical protein